MAAPVYDDEQRKFLRLRLEYYRQRHSNLGVPTLLAHMQAALESTDQYYLDLKSLQRFLKDSHRTDDAKVHRYRKFIDAASPVGFAEQMGELIASGMVYPEGFVISDPAQLPASPEVFLIGSADNDDGDGADAGKIYAKWQRPDIAQHQGVYVLQSFDADGTLRRSAAYPHARDEIMLTVSQNEQALRATTFTFDVPPNGPRVSLGKDIGDGVFMLIGLDEFLLMFRGMSGAWLAMLRKTGDDPTVFEGAEISTGSEAPIPTGGRVRLIKYDGPEFRDEDGKLIG